MHTSDGNYSGSCGCGKVTYLCTGKMSYAAHCHCEDCRRASGADYVSWFGLPRDKIEWKGERSLHNSSESVTRSFCKNCGTPMSFETNIIHHLTHLYAASLNDLALFRPTAHLFWSEKVPWLRLADNLPKYPKGLQHAITNGQNLLSETL